MEISPVLQSKLLFYSAILGVAVGIVRDLFFTLKHKLSKKRAVYLAVELLGDFTNVIILGIGLVLLCYYFNKGEFRGFTVLGALGGFCLYVLTASKAVKIVFAFFLRLSISLIRLVLTPLVKIFKYLVNILLKTIQLNVKALAKIIILMYNIHRKSIALKKARSGFLQL